MSGINLTNVFHCSIEAYVCNLGFGWGGGYFVETWVLRGGWVNPKFWPKGGGGTLDLEIFYVKTLKKKIFRALRARKIFFLSGSERGGMSRPGF